MLKGLVQSGAPLGRWKEQLRRNPFDVKPAFIASGATRQLLPETVLGRPAAAPAVLWSDGVRLSTSRHFAPTRRQTRFDESRTRG